MTKPELVYGTAICPKVSSVDPDLYKSYIEFGQTAGEYSKALVVGNPPEPKSLTSVIETDESLNQTRNSFSDDLSITFKEMDLFTRKTYEDHLAKAEEPHKVKASEEDIRLYEGYTSRVY